MKDHPAVLTREGLERYRLRPVAGEPRYLLLPEDVAEFVRSLVVAGHPPGEYLGAVFVDEAVKALATSVPYLGYLRRLRVEARTFLAPGAILGAAGLLLFHNRPGHGPRPTRRDVRLAKHMLKVGETTGLRLLDYMVLSDGAWTSLQETGQVRFPPLGDPSLPDGRARVKPKYRNPESPHETWSGRGKMALWLKEKLAAGARLEDFSLEE